MFQIATFKTIQLWNILYVIYHWVPEGATIHKLAFVDNCSILLYVNDYFVLVDDL